MLPFFVIIIILIGSVVGQIMFGNKADNDDQAAGKHVASRNSYNSRKAWSFSIQQKRGLANCQPSFFAINDFNFLPNKFVAVQLVLYT